MSGIDPIFFLCLAVFLGGLVSGISGFAFSAIAGAIIFQFYPPTFAVPLMMACALIAQLYGLFKLRKHMEWLRSIPLVLGGVMGMPLGLYALRSIDAHVFRTGFGVFLITYAAFMLLRPTTAAAKGMGGAATQTVIGFLSGVVGGLTAFPGALPTMWCDLRGLPKDMKRGLTQPFIATMQFFGFLLMALHGDLSTELVWNIAYTLPALIAGTILGLAAFGRVNDQMFRRVILSALLVSGVALL
jgi:uncharacterized membrane protein YfcA